MNLNLGPLGIVAYTGDSTSPIQDDRFFFVAEEDWRKEAPLSSAPSVGGAIVARLDDPGTLKRKLFIDLDQLNIGSSTQPSARSEASAYGESSGEWSVIVKKDSDYREIPAGKFTRLPVDSQGEAAVLVRRGALVAAIPQNNIPSGSYCVLANFGASRSNTR